MIASSAKNSRRHGPLLSPFDPSSREDRVGGSKHLPSGRDRNEEARQRASRTLPRLRLSISIRRRLVVSCLGLCVAP